MADDHPFSALAATWRGTGHGEYPTIASFEYTEEFCAKYDQTAFDPDYVSAPLAHYEPLIRQYLVPTA